MMLSNHTKHLSQGVAFYGKYNIKNKVSLTGGEVCREKWSDQGEHATSSKSTGDL